MKRNPFYGVHAQQARDVPNFPAKTWRALGEAGNLPPSRVYIPYSPRQDGIGRDMPNVVLKVPTGGGKTCLEVSALSRIGEQGIPAGENQALPQPPHAPVTVSEGVDEFELDAAVTSSSWLWIGGSSRHPVPGRPAAEAAEGR